MADSLERSLLIKDLENSKLKQRIKELENESIQIRTSHAEVLSMLTYKNENYKRQKEIEIKTKIKQLQQSNQMLMDDLAEARKSECRAEEENVVASEKNCQLTYDLKSMQQENEKCKTQIREISMDSIKKDQELQKTLEDLKQLKQQHTKLQEELENVSTNLNVAKTEIRKQNSQILQLTVHLEESSKDNLQQEALEKTIQKLQSEKSALQLEINETDANRNNMAEILLKNRELLAGNKNLKAENDQLLNENSNLKNQIIYTKEHIEEVKYTLETAQREISELKEKNLRVDAEIGKVSLTLEDEKELLNQKSDLEAENRLLKKKFETSEAEIENITQSIIIMANENCHLKQRIEDLENSNFKRIQIIFKLKTENNQFKLNLSKGI